MMTVFGGGCQCGAVRYEATMAPEGVSYCHCRMCQKAFGAPFAVLAPVRRSHLRFIKHLPNFYRSSSVAERGFCPHCGTPLTFAYADSEWISVAIGSLDRPEQFAPECHLGVEGWLPWLQLQDTLPRLTTGAEDKTGRLAGLVNYQHPDQPA